MSDIAGQNTQQLFKRWRQGDAEAGQAMAQRFSDWYYAIAASRLGDVTGRAPLERACQRFASDVVQVTEANKLAEWAHGIVAEEIRKAGGRVQGADYPNPLTRQRRPSELLALAKAGLTASQVSLLARAYDRDYDMAKLKAEADAAGGYPLAVMESRYALKRWLRANADVRFTELPEKANLDWGPLPLYEGGRMGEGKEERAFEIWMLSDVSLCRDIAEFSAFALALRGGAFAEASEPPPAPIEPAQPKQPPRAVEPRATEKVSTESSGKNNMPLLIGAVVLVILLIVVAAVLL